MFFEHIRRLPVVEDNYYSLLTATLEYPSISIRRSRSSYRGISDFVIYNHLSDTRYRVGPKGLSVEQGQDFGWKKSFFPNSLFKTKEDLISLYFEDINLLEREYRESVSLFRKLKMLLGNPWERFLLALSLFYVLITIGVIYL